ncbi:disease resistance protein RPM1-like [Cornus florida]|uniref:disease resistance protein RPM1-like n=1 Tax=Cornus florida TaxID=4283 RepID=UPI00289B6F14|nr:disease resistance protein RPM1-like [Cornus florida]
MAETAVVTLLNKIEHLFREEGKLLVVPLLDKVEHLFPQQLKLLVRLGKEVEFIKSEFMSLNAFLRDADVTEESDLVLQLWVKEVREVALDTEDAIDELLLRVAIRTAYHHHHHSNGGFIGKVFFFIKTLKSRQRFAFELQSIRCRVREIGERHQKYHHPKFNIISGQGSSSTTVVKNKRCNIRGDALLQEEAELVGIDWPKSELIRWLFDDYHSEKKVISVVGMGGLGKTTLVKKVYDQAVRKHFESQAWITVSPSFKMKDLLIDMIQQLKGSVAQEMERMNTERLMYIIHEFLQGKRYLVVLDDVWDIPFWEDMNNALPNSYGSRIMLTTRSNDIASPSCGEANHNLYTLNPLSSEDSWALFCRKVFGRNPCPPELVELSRSFLQRCEGLPLAIVAIGGVLATKTKTFEEWRKLDSSLEFGSLSNNVMMKGINDVLSLSYNHLPYYLKICFLYLSIFSRNQEIECMRLIRLWMAEGFVQVSQGMTIEEAAEEYLHQLINRSLIQVATATEDGRFKTCRIHNLFFEYINFKKRGENIAAIASQENMRWPDKIRRLSIHNTSIDVQQSKQYFSKLRSLFMFGVTDPKSMSSLPKLLNGGLRLLKVLDMRGASLETLPNEIFQLFHLRYLSLRGTKVKKLSSSIENLQNLQTLDLKDTYVTELPVQIQKLRGLRHLLAYRYNMVKGYQKLNHINGFKAFIGIGGLSSLQKLCYIDASNGSILEELGRLTQLRRLGIVQLKGEDGVALCSSIKTLSNLRSLAISSVNEDEIVDIQSLSFDPPPFLQRLYLRGRLQMLPHWIADLHNLVSVHLEWSKLEDDLLQSFQNLPNLVQVELHQAYEGEELCFKSGGFQKLKTLRLSELNNLRSVLMEESAMPCLEKLYISNCELLEEVPPGIEYLKKLKLLDLGGVPYPLYKSLNREMEGKDYEKIAHIPNVYIEVSRSRFL